MTKTQALRLAKARKAAHEAAFARVAERKEAALRQWEYDHFEPMVHGIPRPDMSQEKYERIISDARKRKQNVFFGAGYNGLQLVPQRGPSFIDTIAAAIFG